MRKILAFFITILIFIFAVTFDDGGILKGEGVHEFYLFSPSSNAKIERLNEEDANSFLYLRKSLKGECVIFSSTENLQKLKNRLFAVKVFTEKGDGFYCEYYYSPLIKDCVYIGGKKINLHFSYQNEQVKVGTPLIFGGF